MTSTTEPTKAPSGANKPWRLLAIMAGVVLGWFALAEAATIFWYSSHEAKLTRNQIPKEGTVLMDRLEAFASQKGGAMKQQDIGSAAMDLLKCSYGKTLVWADGSSPAAATILKWSEDSVVGGVETLHNPGICLSAAGWKVDGQTAFGLQKYGGAYSNVSEWEVSRNGTQMRAFSAVFRRFAESEEAKAFEYLHSERLASVIAGRRDAPVLIVLAYLPVGTSNSDVLARFQEIMRALFPEPGASVDRS